MVMMQVWLESRETPKNSWQWLPHPSGDASLSLSPCNDVTNQVNHSSVSSTQCHVVGKENAQYWRNNCERYIWCTGCVQNDMVLHVRVSQRTPSQLQLVSPQGRCTLLGALNDNERVTYNLTNLEDCRLFQSYTPVQEVYIVWIAQAINRSWW